MGRDFSWEVDGSPSASASESESSNVGECVDGGEGSMRIYALSRLLADRRGSEERGVVVATIRCVQRQWYVYTRGQPSTAEDVSTAEVGAGVGFI